MSAGTITGSFACRQPASPNLPSVEAAGFDGVEIGPESLPLPSDVVWVIKYPNVSSSCLSYHVQP